MSDNKKKGTGQTQKVKLKGDLSSSLSIILPIVGIFVFLIGGFALFVYLEESGKKPNEAYLKAEQLVKDEALIGLTLEECAEVIGVPALIMEKDGDWLFITGYKEFRGGDFFEYYEICVYHENGLAVNAVLRVSE